MDKHIYHLDISKIPEGMHIDEYINNANLASKVVSYLLPYGSEFFIIQNKQGLFTDILNLILSHRKEQERPEDGSETETEDSESES